LFLIAFVCGSPAKTLIKFHWHEHGIIAPTSLGFYRLAAQKELFNKHVNATIKIQSAWRGFQGRRLARAIKEDKASNYQYDLVLMAISRDEGRFLPEWIEYYLMLGVQHFYIADHLSKDNYKEILRPYIERGLVTLERIEYNPQYDWDFYLQVQSPFYNRILNRIEKIAKWSIICDTDEFFVPLEEETILDVLNNCFPADVSAIAFSWRRFGTSGVQRIPAGKTMIETLTRSERYLEPHPKTICKPRDVARSLVHIPEMKPGKKLVMGDGSPYSYKPGVPTFLPEGAEDRRITLESRKLYAHVYPHNHKVCKKNGLFYHYWRRDVDFFRNVKMKRVHMSGFLTSMERDLRAEKWEFNETGDTVIQRFVPNLRERLGFYSGFI
jgi:hypothetical protein